MTFRALLLGTTAFRKWTSPAFEVAARVELEQAVHQLPMNVAAARVALDVVDIGQSLAKAALYIPLHKRVTLQDLGFRSPA